MLDRVLNRLDGSGRGVFWWFWLFLVMTYTTDITDRYDIEDPRHHAIFWGGIIFGILSGIIIWKILGKEKLSAVKSVVIALQGLAVIFILSFFLGLLPFVILLALDFEPPKAAAIPVSVLCYLTGLFLGGCYVGLKIKRLILFWISFIAGLTCLVMIGGASVDFWAMAYTMLLTPAFIGSYLGYRHSSKKADDGADGGAVADNTAALSEG